MYLVDGLRDGGFALVGQAHHALVDGIAAIEVAMLLFDDGSAHPPSSGGRARAHDAQALRDSALTRTAGGARALGALARAAARPGAGAAALRDAAGTLSDMASPAPQTTLDRSLTADRVVAFGSAPLDDVSEAGHRRGATVNDVLLAASTIALDHALRRRGERPHALKALVPINPRAPAPRPTSATPCRSRPSSCRSASPTRRRAAHHPRPHARGQARRRRAAAGRDRIRRRSHAHRGPPRWSPARPRGGVVQRRDLERPRPAHRADADGPAAEGASTPRCRSSTATA